MGERRKHKRFEAKEGAFASIMSVSTKIGPIINISKGGLLFSYIDVDENEPSSDPLELELSLFSGSFCLDKLPVKTISDIMVPGLLSIITMKQSAMQFNELTPPQTSHLEYFIQKHTNKNTD